MSPELGLALVITIGTLVAIALVTLLVVGVVVWALRRILPTAEDPPVVELKRRLAAGEITPAEYEVRLRALEKGD